MHAVIIKHVSASSKRSRPGDHVDPSFKGRSRTCSPHASHPLLFILHAHTDAAFVPTLAVPAEPTVRPTIEAVLAGAVHGAQTFISQCPLVGGLHLGHPCCVATPRYAALSDPLLHELTIQLLAAFNVISVSRFCQRLVHIPFIHTGLHEVGLTAPQAGACWT